MAAAPDAERTFIAIKPDGVQRGLVSWRCWNEKFADSQLGWRNHWPLRKKGIPTCCFEANPSLKGAR
jgi:hypothetical protein